MRNPLKSYRRADSFYDIGNIDGPEFIIGPNDYDLAKRLWKAGTEHRKWMRQVVVWVAITAPRYWWSEFDTYKIGTSANSESTMHRLTKDGVKEEDIEFAWGTTLLADNAMRNLIRDINCLIDYYNQCEDSEIKQKTFGLIKALLPEGFVQKRTVCLNYEVLATMYKQRKNHRLPQWRETFCEWVNTLPHSEFITGNFDD